LVDSTRWYNFMQNGFEIVCRFVFIFLNICSVARPGSDLTGDMTLSTGGGREGKKQCRVQDLTLGGA